MPVKEGIFQLENYSGSGIKVRFSNHILKGNIVHNEIENIIYMSEENRYFFYLMAFGLEKGFEMCREHAIQEVDLIIETITVRRLFNGYSPIFLNTVDHDIEYNFFNPADNAKIIEL